MEINLGTFKTTHINDDKYDYFYNNTYYLNDLHLNNAYNFYNNIYKIPYFYFFGDKSKKNNFKVNYVLSGGCLYNSLVNIDTLDKSESDIDIFFYDTTKNNFISFVFDFAKYLVDKKEEILFETKFYQKDFKTLYSEFEIIEITLLNKKQKFQFINKNDTTNVLELVNMFNIDYVKIFFDFTEFKLYFTEKAIEVFKYWQCPFSHREKLNLKALKKGMRLYKEKDTFDKNVYKQIVNLNEYENLCWIGIDSLDNELLTYLSNKFDELWNLHPKNKSTIIMRENDITAHRYLQSYMNTPSVDTVNIKKSSYMFSKENQTDLPEDFAKILTYVNNKFNHNYNQVVVNWYCDGNDYLPYHKDWTNDRTKNFMVTTVTLCECGGERTFELKDHNDVKQYFAVTFNGTILTLGGMTNSFYKHGIPKEENVKRRISVTFRYFEEVSSDKCDAFVLYNEDCQEDCHEDDNKDEMPVKK